MAHAKTYTLASFPEYFQATIDKRKTHELRTDENSYAVGDILHLEEFEPTTKTYTGRTADVVITFISPGPEPWLPKGHTLMSTRLKDPTHWYTPIAKVFEN